MRNLNELKGQPVAHRMLESYLNRPLPPLLILHGPGGTGKWSAAEALVYQRFCEVGTGCGKCAACRKLAKEEHPDYICFPEGKVFIGDEDDPEPFSVRWLIRKRLRYTPYEAPLRIVVIPAAEQIQNEAETALLKTLEEPPEHTRFIFLTARLENLKSTILSRGVAIEFQSLSREMIHEITRGGLGELEELAGGSLDSIPFFLTPLYREMNEKILDSLDHPLKLLELEKWLHSGEKNAFASLQGEGELDYSGVLDFFGRLFLFRVTDHPQRRAISEAVFELKQGLNQDMAGLPPYLLSRFFHRLDRILYGPSTRR